VKMKPVEPAVPSTQFDEARMVRMSVYSEDLAEDKEIDFVIFPKEIGNRDITMDILFEPDLKNRIFRLTMSCKRIMKDQTMDLKVDIDNWKDQMLRLNISCNEIMRDQVVILTLNSKMQHGQLKVFMKNDEDEG